MRVLYSFPFRIGADRICTTAWHQVVGVDLAGADVTLFTGAVGRNLPSSIRVHTTLSRGRLRVPLSWIGRGYACQLHDWLTSRWLQQHFAEIDLVHGWPLASLRTIMTARKLGIPFFLERPNAHTEYAYESVAEECRQMGIVLPTNHDHKFNRKCLVHEEQEYAGANFLLCPSEFVMRTFRSRGFSESKLLRHQYGYELNQFTPGFQVPPNDRGLVMLYAGVCEPRKGLHYALEAWLASGAHLRGTFIVCGEFVPEYAEKLSGMLSHPSVKVLGHRSDLPEIMRQSDLFVLPSVEEGSALVTYEARGAGCVLLVSDSSGAVCEHNRNGLIHLRRDVRSLTNDIRRVNRDRALLTRLRESSLSNLSEITWTSAARRLLDAYSTGVGGCADYRRPSSIDCASSAE